MKNNYISFNVEEDNVNLRLDRYIFQKIEESDITVSRTMIQKLIESEMISVNGIKRNKSYKVVKDDFISLVLPPPVEYTLQAEDIPLDIVYEDKHLLVVNKEKGMVVHIGNGHHDGTLVNAVLFHCGDELTGIGGVLRPGIVHRIDKDTTGLLVVAKDEMTYASLARQLYAHTVKREYHAICHGIIKSDAGTIDKPIGRDSSNRKKFAVNETGKNAITDYSVLKHFDGYTYVVLRLHTGRTHQIRVHMSYLGHPLAGDILYGPKSTPKELMGQCLHAKTLGFIHPISNDWIEYDSSLPAYFTQFIKSISKGDVYD